MNWAEDIAVKFEVNFVLKSLFTAFAHTQNAPPVELLEVSKNFVREH